MRVQGSSRRVRWTATALARLSTLSALSTSPLNYISFSDADSESALAFVKSRIAEVEGRTPSLSSKEVELICRLGGRASDLQTVRENGSFSALHLLISLQLVHKIQNGESLTFAMEDIINRGVAEIRKTTFGDDSEESKSLPWSQIQAWTIIKQLAANDEV